MLYQIRRGHGFHTLISEHASFTDAVRAFKELDPDCWKHGERDYYLCTHAEGQPRSPLSTEELAEFYRIIGLRKTMTGI